MEVSRELKPSRWGGYLGVDGKELRIGHRDTASLMIGVDQATQDIVHALVLPIESGAGFVRLVTEAVTDARYPLRGVVADLGPGAPPSSFPQASTDYFGRLPFQACRVHFDRRLDLYLPAAKNQPGASLRAELKTRIRRVLYAPTYQEAFARYYQLAANESRYTTLGGHHNLIKSLRRTFGLYMTHHHHPGLPADSNITENVIRQLNHKLHLMEHFATIQSAEHFSRLLIGCYRWKRFTDSNNGHNGKSPLELAGVTLPTTNWLTYHQQTHSM